MYFNHRILEEARKDTVPVLERLSFLGIYSNNLDEFFRVRVANINRIALCKEKSAKAEIANAQKLQKTINKLNAKYSKEYIKAVEEVTEQLRLDKIYIVDENEITDEQRKYVKHYYHSNLIGRVSPPG